MLADFAHPTVGNPRAGDAEIDMETHPEKKILTNHTRGKGDKTYPWPGPHPMIEDHRYGDPAGSMRRGGRIARDRRHLLDWRLRREPPPPS